MGGKGDGGDSCLTASKISCKGEGGGERGNGTTEGSELLKTKEKKSTHVGLDSGMDFLLTQEGIRGEKRKFRQRKRENSE